MDGMKTLLCRVGSHRWQKLDVNEVRVIRECEHCGILQWGNLSRTGELHYGRPFKKGMLGRTR